MIIPVLYFHDIIHFHKPTIKWFLFGIAGGKGLLWESVMIFDI